jgi:hypothetical protein
MVKFIRAPSAYLDNYNHIINIGPYFRVKEWAGIKPTWPDRRGRDAKSNLTAQDQGALTVDRPYRRAMSFAEAADYIESASGRLFDPEIITKFRATRNRLREFVARIVL